MARSSMLPAWYGRIHVYVTPCDPMDYSPPGSPVHGIFPERILEWVAMLSCRVSSWPRDWTYVSSIAGGLFTPESPGKPIEEGWVCKNEDGIEWAHVFFAEVLHANQLLRNVKPSSGVTNPSPALGHGKSFSYFAVLWSSLTWGNSALRNWQQERRVFIGPGRYREGFWSQGIVKEWRPCEKKQNHHLWILI